MNEEVLQQMPIGNEYFAEPQRLRSSIQMIRDDNANFHRILADYAEGSRRYSGWNGTDDSFYRESQEGKEKEDAAARDTGSAMGEASEAITNGVLANTKNITDTQEGAFESIQDAGRRRKGGSH
ncbi:hypothetical protein ACN6LL_001889 [Streptomyces violaceoruber]